MKDGATASPPPRIPDHDLLRCIGRGAYGEVWLSRSITGNWRAIKIVRRNSFEDERPFNREFNGITRFEPISRAYDTQVDILHVGRGDGFFYYVMELADDEEPARPVNPETYRPRTLKSELSRRGKLPAAECVSISLQLTKALTDLHQEQLVHRDIKPSNVVFIRNVPKLADIGLVTSTDATVSFVGTHGFSPPEGPGTSQGDIYSLGKVLYELFSGRDRHDFPDLPTDIVDHQDKEVLLELNAIVGKACAPNPTERYGSAEEMRGDLLMLQMGESVRRNRLVASRVRNLGRAVTVLALATMTFLVAYLYQNQQTRKISRLAKNIATLETKSRADLLRLQIKTGNDLVERGEAANALLWFTTALAAHKGPGDEDAIHRLRLRSVLDHTPRLLQIVTHTSKVNAAEFSPDGRFFATASDDFTARVWDCELGRAVTPPLPHSNKVVKARFDNNGTRVLTMSWDGSARIWNAITGEPLGLPLTHDGYVHDGFFSPAGDEVVTVGGGVAVLWDARSCKKIAAFGPDGVRRAEFSRDGHVLLTTDAFRGVLIWNGQTGEPLRGEEPLAFPTHRYSCATFDPRSLEILVITQTEDFNHSSESRIWDIKENRWRASIQHSPPVSYGAFSSKGVVATYGDGGLVQLWNPTNGAPIGTPLAHDGAVYSASFSREGDYLVTAGDDAARVWNVNSGRLHVAPLRHAGAVTSAAFDPSGTRVLTCSVDGSAKLWNIALRQPSYTNDSSEDRITYAAVAPSGRWVALCRRGKLSTLWNPYTGASTNAPLSAESVQFSPDGKHLLTSGWEMTRSWAPAELWTFNEAWQLRQVIGSTGVTDVAFSSDGQMIAVAGIDRMVQIWDKVGSNRLHEIRHPDVLSHIEFSRGSRTLLTTCYDGFARLWAIEQTNRLVTQVKHGRAVRWGAFSADGKSIITISSDGTARLWSAVTGEPLTAPLQHSTRVTNMRMDSKPWYPNYSVDVTSDGRRALTLGPGCNLRLWATDEGKMIAAPSIGNSVFAYAHAEFSPDGRLIASVNSDGTGRVWDSDTGEAVSVPLRHAGRVTVVRFSPDGKFVLTGGSDGSAKLWPLIQVDGSIDDLTTLSHVLAGCFIDETQNYSPLPVATIAANLASLRTKHPEWFADRQEPIRQFP